jgi:hypothetical protein
MEEQRERQIRLYHKLLRTGKQLRFFIAPINQASTFSIVATSRKKLT